MSTVIYEFTDYEIAEYWATWPQRMVDGIEDSYAYTSLDGDIQKLITNECDGSDLGIISKVELRYYGYGDENDQVILRPVFGGSIDGQGWTTIPGPTPQWNNWRDITNDGNAPDWSSWSHIQDLDCDVEYNKVGKGNTMYCSMVQIQVTYEPSGPPSYYHGLTVQGEGELALCDAESHPLRIRKGGTTYGIELLAVDDPNASRVRIKTPTGIKAIRKYT